MNNQLDVKFDQSNVQFQHELDKVNTVFLKYMMAGLSLYYLVWGLMYISFDPAIRLPLIAVSWITSLYGFSIYSAIKKNTFNRKYLTIGALSAAAVLMLNMFLNYYLTKDPMQIYFCFSSVIALSLTTTKIRVWGMQIVFGVLAFYYILLQESLDLQSHSILFFSGLVLSAIFLFSRRQIVKNQIQLLLLSRSKNDELEKANKVKDTFVATISHELRTPLTSIKGAHDLLMSGI